MPGPKWHETRRGRRFMDGTIPEFVNEVGRLADALEEHNELKKEELRNDPENEEAAD